MKKFTAIIITTLSLATSYGQTKLPAKDTASLSDTTKFLSIADLNRLSEPLKNKVTFNAYQNYASILQSVIGEAIKEWEGKQKSVTNKTGK